MKKKCIRSLLCRETFCKVCLIMKLSFLFIILFVFAGYANTNAQNQLVDLELKEATYSELFREIYKQTGLRFIYNSNEITKLNSIDISAKNKSVDDVLKDVLKDTEYTYVFENDVVMLVQKQSNVMQQTQVVVVKGIVTDVNNEPLPGVTIQLEGSTMGVATDIDGNFSLSLPVNSGNLVFSFVGYKSQTLAFSGDKELKVVLEEDVTEVEEVVVTGMFTRRANSYTGSITSIKGEELKAVGNSNILNSLKNIDPSFMFVENLAAGSNPNALPEIEMRGQTGLGDVSSEYQNNPNQPLFILDGFESTITKIMDLDMNLVESITLLKDATAKAIYGSKAANGVVIVETKRPEKGRMKISYTGTLDIQVPDLTSYNLTNAREKLEAEVLAGFFISDNALTQTELASKYSEILKEVTAGVNTYWLDKPLRVDVGNRHSLYLEGGDEYMLYGVDLAYQNVTGVMKGSNRNTISGGVTLSYRLDNFIFRNKLSIDDNISNDSPYGSFSDFAKINPYNKIYDEKGNMIKVYDNLKTEYNPLWNKEVKTKYQSKYTTVTNNFYTEWQALQSLKVTGRFGFSKTISTTDKFKPADHTDFETFKGELYQKGSYEALNRIDQSISGDLGIGWSFYKNNHMIFFNGQLTIAQQKYDYYTVQAQGFPNDNMDHISFAVEYKEERPRGSEGISREFGGIGSVNYSYADRYLFDANYRATGSSEFGADKRWGHFYSLGIGWNLHEEKFMQDVEWLNRLKLRASTGYTGSQGFNSYDAIRTMTYYKNGQYNGSIGSHVISLANPNLKWQKVYDNNIGIDLNAFNNRLTGRFDYYLSTTKGLVTQITTPQSMGFDQFIANLGEVENKGYEIYVSGRVWDERKTNSYFNIYASLASNKNKLKKISNALKQRNEALDAEKDTNEEGNDRTSLNIRYEEGKSTTTLWVVKSLGIDPQTGREVFVKKDGSLTYNWDSEDYVSGGDSRPKVSGNFGFNMDYRGWGMNVAFTWQYGGQIYNYTLLNKVENADVYYNVDKRVLENRWSYPGQVARFKSIADDSDTQPTSRFVEDYNVLNFASLNISYDFREWRFVKNSFLERFKATFYMNDLFTVSSVKTERGTDYPFARTFSLSLQATF